MKGDLPSGELKVLAADNGFFLAELVPAAVLTDQSKSDDTLYERWFIINAKTSKVWWIVKDDSYLQELNGLEWSYFKKGLRIKPTGIMGGIVKVLASNRGIILAKLPDVSDLYNYLIDETMTSHWKVLKKDLNPSIDPSADHWSYFRPGIEAECFDCSTQCNKITGEPKELWMPAINDDGDQLFIHPNLNKAGWRVNPSPK